MKLAIISESETDDLAIRILVDAILGQQTEVATVHELVSRGWPSVKQLLPAIIKSLYRTDTDALVVVVDSDLSTPHSATHEADPSTRGTCRLCGLREIIERFQIGAGTGGRARLNTAVGLAVPEIAAWYRCGIDGRVTEATWVQALPTRAFPYTKDRLKQDVMGGGGARARVSKERAVEEARRLAGDLEALRANFPHGFGSMAAEIRSWRTSK